MTYDYRISAKNRNISESHLIKEICSGNEKACEELFFEYYYQLCRFAVTITNCSELARDVVQEVFLKIWQNRKNLDIQHSLKAYLYQSVRNHALNMLEQQGARHRLSDRLTKETDMQPDPAAGEDNNYSGELDVLVSRIWELVNEMPEQRRLVFILHRKHGLSYPEISEVMHIARKTVENHMGRAFRELREKLDINHSV